MSAWTDLGLPLPNAKGYAYTRDAALLRSPFDSAIPDQDQRNTNFRKTFEVSWDLTLEQLPLAEQYLLQYGYSWFDLELVSNETPVNEIISTHQIRLISNYKIQPIAGLYLRLTAQIESRINPQSCELITCDTVTNFDDPICDFIPETSIFVSTNLYPTEVIESLKSTGFLITASVFKGFVENIDTTALLTLGSVVNTLVPYTLEPEEIDTTAILTYGLIFSTLTTITLDPDNMDTTAILTFGSIEDTLVIYTHPSNDEKITSVGTLLSAIFE